ncbi:MAG: hypothetical protein WDM96_09665 [Lacunisphaera sp.]
MVRGGLFPHELVFFGELLVLRRQRGLRALRGGQVALRRAQLQRGVAQRGPQLGAAIGALGGGEPPERKTKAGEKQKRDEVRFHG